MNGALRQGMIPQSAIGQPQTMLSIRNPSFSVQNPVPLGSQQPLGPTSHGMPQNMQSSPPMTILSGGPVPPNNGPRYSAAIQGPLQQQQRQMVPRPPQNSSQATNAPASHIQSQLQPIPFPSSVLQGSLGGNNAMRRTQSHPQININPVASIPPSVTGTMSMGMNQQTAMPGQVRQVAGQPQNSHQLHQMRMQHQQQQSQMLPQSNIDIMMRNQVPGNPASMAARMAPTQGQVMSSLTQPPLGSSPHPAGMPPPPHNTFNSTMPSTQLSASPRPTSTQGMPMGTPGPSHAPINRPRTSPDGSSALPYMSYSAAQFPGTSRGIPPSPPSYHFVPATSPPMQMSDIPQSSAPGIMPSHSGNPANKTGFFPTPAQQHLDMAGADAYNAGFSMPPPSIPNQLPSLASASIQQPPLPSTSQTPSLPHPQQQQRPPQPSPSPQQHVYRHQHGQQMPEDQIHGLSQGPHPQSQGGGVTGGVSSTSQPPRGQPVASNDFAGGLTAAGRLPVSQQTQGPSLPPQSTPQQSQGLGAISSRPSISGGSATMPPPPTASNVSTGPVSTSSPPPNVGIEQAGNRGKSSTYYNNPPPQEKQGLGLMRLLQFSGILSNENSQKHNLSYWDELIKEYFTPKATMRLTLWKDNQRIEAKPFEIGVPILPRFFLVTTQSGVKSMSLSLDSARERMFQTGHTVVECLGASWTYRYRNGYTVTLRGPLTAHVIATSKTPPGSNNGNANDIMYKFDEIQFDANFHDKYISLESILGARSIENLPPQAPIMMLRSPSVQAAVVGGSQSQNHQQQAEDDRRWEEPRVLIDHASLPGEPVNAFGIPQATMRCLELAESVTSMAELIQFAKEASKGPIDALKDFAVRLRESSAVPSNHPMNVNPSFYPAPPSTSSSATLYSGNTSPSTAHSMPPGSTPINTAAMSSPPNSGVNSPEKQPPRTIPQQTQQAQTSSAPATSPAMSASTPTGTLKRKQTGDAASPTMGNEQQPQKRISRKRGRTGTG